MIIGEMAGSVSCTDRKQAFLIILSFLGSAVGTGSKTCTLLSLVAELLHLHQLFRLNFSHLVYPHYSFL